MKTGNVVLLTGGSSGIGRATATLLAHNGCHVYGTARRPERVEPIAGVNFISLDVCDDKSVETCVATVLGKEGRIDTLINNAGVLLYGANEENSIEEAKALFETNFFGALRVTKAVLPTMRQAGSGHVINIGSVSGFVPTPFEGMYCASKRALEGATTGVGDNKFRRLPCADLRRS